MQVKNFIAAAAVVALGFGAVSAQATTVKSSFQVQMTITSVCAVTSAPTPSLINLGTFAATTTALTTANGSTTFKVNCSNKTPFYVGLAPSNANTLGVGAMSGTGGNTDKVPYTLYQDAGFSTVWGNTATSSSAGNGESGTGAGMASANAVSFIAYVQATSSDYKPDIYTDTVTVNVNY
ncbi:MAG: SCPU domain-containing protein [Burkholderiaceae bacterium]|nr:MAG: SCPU domain-containing protein [Burkholderiaceae bacterium]